MDCRFRDPFTSRNCRRVCRKFTESNECSRGEKTECLSSGKVAAVHGTTGRLRAAMNIDKQYAWQSDDNSRENNPLLPRNVRGLVIGKSGCGKTTVIFNLLLQPNWLDCNPLYVFGKSLHQQEYRVLRKGFEAGLSKQQISNVFANQ